MLHRAARNLGLLGLLLALIAWVTPAARSADIIINNGAHRALLMNSNSYVAVAQADLTQSSSLPAFMSGTFSGLATQFDSTGKLTYRPNNLVLNSATLSTQTVAVQAGVNYVLSIKGTGSVTNSGANASTLNGTGASNRVNLAFTASTASLMLTVTGSVTAARLSAVTYETTLRSQDDVDTTAAAYYGPRFDYSYNGAAWVPAGLLVEGAATNLLVRSGDQSNASWSVLGGTVTPLAGAAPDGVSSAYTLALSGASLSGVRQLLPWTAGNTGTFTFYVRSSSSGGAANVRLTTNNSVAWSTGITTKLALTSQWQRITLSGALTSSGTQIFTIVGNANADGTVDATCAGNVDVAFAQLEAGAMATSYIPTGAFAVTRAAETLTFSGYASNPFAIYRAPESTGSFACNKYADQATANAAIAAANQWIKSVKIWPVGTPLAQQGC